MAELVATGSLPAGPALADWIRRIAGTQDCWLLLERIPNRWIAPEEFEDGLRLVKLDAALQLHIYESGYAFCERFEARWEYAGHDVRLRYIGALRDDLAPLEPVPFSLEAQAVARSYVLWGERVSDEDLKGVGIPEAGPIFATLRIPRLLRYPIADGAAKSVAITVLEFDSPGDDAAGLWRFAGVEQQ